MWSVEEIISSNQNNHFTGTISQVSGKLFSCNIITFGIRWAMVTDLVEYMDWEKLRVLIGGRPLAKFED